MRHLTVASLTLVKTVHLLGNKTAQGNGGVGEDFYYTPPTGYKALNTDNLDDPAIALPTDYFNTVLYSGTGGSQSITTLDFSTRFNLG